MIKRKKLISIGVICFNEEPNVGLSYIELKKIAQKEKKYQFEFIYVDNGSIDNTKKEILKISKIDKRVRGIFLSRNFGPEASSQASLDLAKGDAFILYEGDMQDPPEIVYDFIREWEKGFKAVVGIRDKTEDNLFMTLVRKFYYSVFKSISNIEVPINAGSFGLLDRKVVEAIKTLPEKYRFYRGLRAWVGFDTSYIRYHRQRRKLGKSSYNFLGYIKHAERSFFGFSYLPLDIIVYLGLLLVFISFITLIIYLFIFGKNIDHTLLIVFSIVLFGGIQILAISIIGKYIQVIVEETKSRPSYVIEEIVGKS